MQPGERHQGRPCTASVHHHGEESRTHWRAHASERLRLVASARFEQQRQTLRRRGTVHRTAPHRTRASGEDGPPYFAEVITAGSNSRARVGDAIACPGRMSCQSCRTRSSVARHDHQTAAATAWRRRASRQRAFSRSLPSTARIDEPRIHQYHQIASCPQGTVGSNID